MLELREALEAWGGSLPVHPCFFLPPFYNLQRKSYGWEAFSMDALWHDLLHPDVSILEKVMRPILVYLFLIISLRLAGKRELAQLNPFDLVVLMTLSNTVQNAIIGNDNSLLGGLIGATTLLVVNYVVVRFLYTHESIDRIIEGDAELLIDNGVLQVDQLKKELITTTELTEAAHKQGFASLAEIDRAVMEPGGTLTFVAKKPLKEEVQYNEILQRLERIAQDIEALRR
jgi:uncharacterized membrane protein YcaP (DUF421 family)